MTHLISEVQMPKHLAGKFMVGGENETDSRQWLPNLSTLNVLIGTNNTGKSRLLRGLAAEVAEPYVLNDPSIDAAVTELNELHSFCKGSLDLIPPNPEHHHRALADSLIVNLGNAWLIDRRSLAEQTIDDLNQALARGEGQIRTVMQQAGNSELTRAARRMVDALTAARSRLSRLSGPLNQERTLKKVYIPQLRGLRPLAGNEDVYEQRVQSDHFGKLPVKGSLQVVTGLGFYSQLRSYLLGSLRHRQTVRSYERYLADTFFEKQPVTLVPKENDDVLHLKVGDEAEYPIYDLGDGLQQLIILTLPMFLNRDVDLLLFIEEPELFLHPGLQRTLIDTIFDYNGPATRQVFVTTHSHQFLDITMDRNQVSIFRCSKELPEGDHDEKEATCDVELVSGDTMPVLRELGVRNSSVLLTNCTIWVEGITDRMYYRHFLRLLQETEGETYFEDTHFSFVEYGGGNITHWSFLDDDGPKIDRLCGRLLLIADKDEGKDSRHVQLKDVLGERFHRLVSREVENLLAPDVIAAVVATYEGEKSPSTSFTRKNYMHKPLGEFIESLGGMTRQGGYAEPSGTLKTKVRFAEKAIGEMKDFSILSGEAQDLARKMLAFIAEHNQ